MKTTENNKLIAEFMGFEKEYPNSENWFKKYIEDEDVWETRHVNQLQFHTSWEWLMPVVEKIESLGFEFFIVENRSKVKHNTDHSIDVLCYLEGGSKIDITHQTVVEFIKWYNENKTK
jgi:hypothetical protein